MGCTTGCWVLAFANRRRKRFSCFSCTKQSVKQESEHKSPDSVPMDGGINLHHLRICPSETRSRETMFSQTMNPARGSEEWIFPPQASRGTAPVSTGWQDQVGSKAKAPIHPSAVFAQQMQGSVLPQRHPVDSGDKSLEYLKIMRSQLSKSVIEQRASDAS